MNNIIFFGYDAECCECKSLTNEQLVLLEWLNNNGFLDKTVNWVDVDAMEYEVID